MIFTDGPDQNSYIALEDANAILLTMAPSFVGDDGFSLLGMEDERLLIEAAQDLESYWAWNGHPTDPAQALQWPRQHVEKPGFQRPREPGWGSPYTADAWTTFYYDYLRPGISSVPYLDAITVPNQIKQAQALLALLRKNKKNLVGDSQGDTQGLQLDVGFKIAYVNAARDSQDITKRLAGLGWFIGDELIRLPNV